MVVLVQDYNGAVVEVEDEVMVSSFDWMHLCLYSHLFLI